MNFYCRGKNNLSSNYFVTTCGFLSSDVFLLRQQFGDFMKQNFFIFLLFRFLLFWVIVISFGLCTSCFSISNNKSTSIQSCFLKLNEDMKIKSTKIAKEKRLICDIDKMKSVIQQSFLEKNDDNCKSIIGFLKKINNKDSEFLSLIVYDSLKEYNHSNDVQICWLFWVAFYLRQQDLSKHRNVLTTTFYQRRQIQEFIGWRMQRLDDIMGLLDTIRCEDFNDIGVSFCEFKNFMIKEINNIRAGKGLYIYSSSFHIENSNKFFDEFSKYAYLPKSTNKYILFNSFCNALNNSFKLSNDSISEIADFISVVKTFQPDVLHVILNSLQNNKNNINYSYICWLSYMMNQIKIQSEGDDKPCEEIMMFCEMVVGLSVTDCEVIVKRMSLFTDAQKINFNRIGLNKEEFIDIMNKTKRKITRQ